MRFISPCLAFWCLFLSSLHAQDKLPNTGDSTEAWNTVLDAAQSEKKKIILYLSVPQSEVCETFESDTLDHPVVEQYLQNFTIWAHLDSESQLMGEALTQRYSVDSWPCVLVLDSQGKEVGRVVNKPDAAQFIQELNRILIPSIAPQQDPVSPTPILVGFIDTARMQKESQMMAFYQNDLDQLQQSINEEVQDQMEAMHQAWDHYQATLDSGKEWTAPIPQNPDRISVNQQVQRTFSEAQQQLSKNYYQWIGEAALPLIGEKEFAMVAGPKIFLQGDPLSVELIDITDELIPLYNNYLNASPSNRNPTPPTVEVPTSYIRQFSGIKAAEAWMDLFKEPALMRAHAGEDINDVLAEVQEGYSLALKTSIPTLRELYHINLIYDSDGSSFFQAKGIENADQPLLMLLMEIAAQFPR